jgi:hypothetical protein
MKLIATIWVWSLVALTACEHVVERETSSAERMGAKAEVELPQPDESGTYFLWTPEEQLAGYRNIAKIFDTHPVEASGTPGPLPKADRALDVSYDISFCDCSENR